MKKTLFSRGLYIEGLRQLRLSGIIILVLCLFVGIISPVSQYIDYKNYYVIQNITSEYTPRVTDINTMFPASFAIFLIVAPIFTFMLFSTFNRRSSSDFYHSLPYTRMCMFLSFSAAVFTWILGIAVVSGVITVGMHAIFPELFIVSLEGTFDMLLTLFASSVILIFGIIAAMSLTGTPLSNIVSAGLLLFLPRLLIFLVTNTISNLAPIIGSHFGIFSLRYNVLLNMIASLFISFGSNEMLMGNIKCDVYSIVLGLAYAIIAAILFCKRKSETASHATNSRFLQSVIRICVGFVISSIVTSALICGEDFTDLWPLYVLAVIAYFAYELITVKSFKKLHRVLPGLAILILMNVALVGCCLAGRSVIHSFDPEPEDISAIYLTSSEDDSDYYYRNEISFREYVTMNASKIKIKNKKAIEIATEMLHDNVERSKNGSFHSFRWEYKEDIGYYTEEETVHQLTVVYITKGGSEKTRDIYLSQSVFSELMGEVSKIKEYNEKYTELPEPTSNRTISVYYTDGMHCDFPLSENDASELLKTMQDEIKELDMQKWIDYTSSAYDSSYQITYRPKGLSVDLIISFDKDILPKTASKLISLSVNSSKEYRESFTDLIRNLFTKETYNDYYHFSIQVQAFDERPIWNMYLEQYYVDMILNAEIYANEPDYKPEIDEDMAEVILSDIDALLSELDALKDEEPTADKYLIARVFANAVGKASEEYCIYLPYPDDFTPIDDFVFYIYPENMDTSSEYVLTD